jgi:hypothetical protein
VPALAGYRGAVDVQRAADLYAQGWTLRQISAELGVHWSTVSQHLKSAGVTIRSIGPAAHPTSTEQILELRDQGLTWNEVAKQVDMTVSGAWSPIGGPSRRSPNGWAVGSRCSPAPLTSTLRLVFGRRWLVISVERPPGLS